MALIFSFTNKLFPLRMWTIKAEFHHRDAMNMNESINFFTHNHGATASCVYGVFLLKYTFFLLVSYHNFLALLRVMQLLLTSFMINSMTSKLPACLDEAVTGGHISSVFGMTSLKVLWLSPVLLLFLQKATWSLSQSHHHNSMNLWHFCNKWKIRKEKTSVTLVTRPQGKCQCFESCWAHRLT